MQENSRIKLPYQVTIDSGLRTVGDHRKYHNSLHCYPIRVVLHVNHTFALRFGHA